MAAQPGPCPQEWRTARFVLRYVPLFVYCGALGDTYDDKRIQYCKCEGISATTMSTLTPHLEGRVAPVRSEAGVHARRRCSSRPGKAAASSVNEAEKTKARRREHSTHVLANEAERAAVGASLRASAIVTDILGSNDGQEERGEWEMKWPATNPLSKFAYQSIKYVFHKVRAYLLSSLDKVRSPGRETTRAAPQNAHAPAVDAPERVLARRSAI